MDSPGSFRKRTIRASCSPSPSWGILISTVAMRNLLHHRSDSCQHLIQIWQNSVFQGGAVRDVNIHPSHQLRSGDEMVPALGIGGHFRDDGLPESASSAIF